MNKTKKTHMLLPLLAAAFFASSLGKAHASPAAETNLTPVAQAVVLGAVQAVIAQAISASAGAPVPAATISAAVSMVSAGYLAENAPAGRPAK